MPRAKWGSRLARSILRVLEQPGDSARLLRGLVRGWQCKVWFRLKGVRFEAGRRLVVQGKLIVRGPGRVIFGDNVRIGMRVTPWTYNPDAVILVGDDAYLNGTTFGCQREITVGSNCILGTVAILDTDFHSTRIDRHSPHAPVRVAPVQIGANVWIGANAGVLPGTRIGDNSVVGFGAVCSGEYPANVIIAGNPARVVKPIPLLDDASGSPNAAADAPRR